MSKCSIPSKSVTVLLSGGIDSVCCVHFFKSKGYAVQGLFIDYGQASAMQERLAVEKAVSLLAIEIQYLTIPTESLIGPGEHIGRNAFLIFTAIFLARIDSGLLAIGIHSGTSYYDCSNEFYINIEKTVEEYTGGALRLVAPLKDWDKATIYQYFHQTGIPSGVTYSCELGMAESCQRCDSCKDRRFL
jgi:7-cyano-7-deazaguanine synthase